MIPLNITPFAIIFCPGSSLIATLLYTQPAMGAKTLVIGAVLFISFAIFVMFFGRLPALRYESMITYISMQKLIVSKRSTPIGFLHRLLAVHLPRGLNALDQRLTNGQMYTSSSRLIRYLLNDRHPTVLVRFLILLLCPRCFGKVRPTEWDCQAKV
jgi:hypothetical protein